MLRRDSSRFERRRDPRTATFAGDAGRRCVQPCWASRWWACAQTEPTREVSADTVSPGEPSKLALQQAHRGPDRRRLRRRTRRRERDEQLRQRRRRPRLQSALPERPERGLRPQAAAYLFAPPFTAADGADRAGERRSDPQVEGLSALRPLGPAPLVTAAHRIRGGRATSWSSATSRPASRCPSTTAGWPTASRAAASRSLGGRRLVHAYVDGDFRRPCRADRRRDPRASRPAARRGSAPAPATDQRLDELAIFPGHAVPRPRYQGHFASATPGQRADADQAAPSRPRRRSGLERAHGPSRSETTSSRTQRRRDHGRRHPLRRPSTASPRQTTPSACAPVTGFGAKPQQQLRFVVTGESPHPLQRDGPTYSPPVLALQRPLGRARRRRLRSRPRRRASSSTTSSTRASTSASRARSPTTTTAPSAAAPPTTTTAPGFDRRFGGRELGAATSRAPSRGSVSGSIAPAWLAQWGEHQIRAESRALGSSAAPTTSGYLSTPSSSTIAADRRVATGLRRRPADKSYVDGESTAASTRPPEPRPPRNSPLTERRHPQPASPAAPSTS